MKGGKSGGRIVTKANLFENFLVYWQGRFFCIEYLQ